MNPRNRDASLKLGHPEESDRQLTLFKNNAGQGMADVATAARVYQRARERGLGMELPIGVWSASHAGRVAGAMQRIESGAAERPRRRIGWGSYKRSPSTTQASR